MSWYRLGTVTVTQGSATVTGAGTLWSNQVLPGDILFVQERFCEVKEVVSDTKIEIVAPFAGSAASAVSYAVIRNFTKYDNFRLITDIEAFLSDRDVAQKQLTDWMSGAIDGGPNGDGTYPLTDRFGNTVWATAPKALILQAEQTTAEVAQALEDISTALPEIAAAESHAIAAKTSKDAAAGSQSAAASSASDAASAATSATASKNQAGTSATNAGNSATAASTSAGNAATSATKAANSASAALASENAAGASETAAAGSAATAVSSATAANTSKNQAATSATNAAGSATAATTSATNAGNSAAAAAGSATAANASKSQAQTSAGDAAASEAAAADSEAAAANSAAVATTKAGESSVSATLSRDWATKTSGEVVAGQGHGARKYANDAAASAGTATGAATTATTKAGEASSSATAANTSKNQAASSATNAATSESNAASSATAAADSAMAAAGFASTATTKAQEAAVSAETATQAASSVANGMYFAGVWNATVGYPPNPTKGNPFYKVSVAGVIGAEDFAIGDSIVWDGSGWFKLDGTDRVSSVAGKVGAVTVTKGDVGLNNVDNTSDASKPISTAVQAALAAKANVSDLSAHASNTGNPHGVTKAQVGLGSVDNTSDANKPVSTATQTALNGKLSTTGGVLTGGLFIRTAGNAQIELGRVDGVASTPVLDFHSSGDDRDYDSRIVASGGGSNNGNGVLTYAAAEHVFNGLLKSGANPVWHSGNGATQAEALAGTNNSKGVTPLRVKEYVEQFGIGSLAAALPNNDMSVVDNSIPSGIYRITSTTVGRPTNWGSLIHIRRATGGGEVQIVISDETTAMGGAMMTRYRNVGGWGEWRRQWDNLNFDPATKLDKSGGTMTGALTATTFSVASTIPAVTLRETDTDPSLSSRVAMDNGILYLQAPTGSAIRITGYLNTDIAGATIRSGGTNHEIWHAGNGASQAEAEAGIDNTKGMTPLRVKQAIEANTQSLTNLAQLHATALLF